LAQATAESLKTEINMLSIEKCVIVPNSVLAIYTSNGYVDSYRTELPGYISLEDFVFHFYTTALFKLERFILTWSVLKPSKDIQAKELSQGKTDKFAAWTVEDRRENELLMCDMLGRTRSWLMVNHSGTKEQPRTQLYFGTAVVPAAKLTTGSSSIGLFFIALLPFHKIYSVLLLYFARQKLIHRSLS
jgi:hypothetical protein